MFTLASTIESEQVAALSFLSLIKLPILFSTSLLSKNTISLFSYHPSKSFVNTLNGFVLWKPF